MYKKDEIDYSEILDLKLVDAYNRNEKGVRGEVTGLFVYTFHDTKGDKVVSIFRGSEATHGSFFVRMVTLIGF